MKCISSLLITFVVSLSLSGQNKVYDLIASSPDHNILETAIDLAGLKDPLNGDGPFTVFAPTDAAIQALPAGVLDALLADPTGALKNILLYHVVGAQALSTDLSDGQEIQTLLANKKVRVTINAEGVFINDAKVTVANLIADNGVVHVINAVLLPARTTVYDIIAASPDHTILETAVDLAGLKDALNSNGPFTVFAPTDAAIQALPAGVLDALIADTTGALKDILLYHVVGAQALSTDLSDGQQIQTLLANKKVRVTINAEGVFINDAKVTVANLITDNGVVHVINVVLLPARTTVYDIIAASPDHTILETAVDLAGLKAALNSDGPFTVFAPTDAAIQALPAGVLDALIADTTGALKDILLYHVVGAQALSTDLSDGQEIQTLLANKKVRVTINAEGVFINDAKVTLADLIADNGVVHVINAVLLPARTTVYDIIASSPDHTILETAINLAGLKDALNSDGPFTVFAPTDAAIQALPAGVLDALIADTTGALKDILLYHVVGAQALSTDLSDGQEIQTLLTNKKVRVTINAEGVFINDAKVTVADLIADNGVVHVINAVLLPARTTVYDIIATSPDHTILETAINLSGLKDALNSDGPFTVFAPTDAAIQSLPPGVLDELLKDPQGALKDLLLFHVANGKSLSTDLNDGQQITSLAGGALTVKINMEGVFINNAKVTIADLAADNGVVHVIDAVLTSTSSSNNIILDGVKVYPNPFTEFVQIDLPNSTAQALKIEILDVQGKLIQSINSSSSTERIFVEGAPGTYILRMVTEDVQQELKLIKK